MGATLSRPRRVWPEWLPRAAEQFGLDGWPESGPAEGRAVFDGVLAVDLIGAGGQLRLEAAVGTLPDDPLDTEAFLRTALRQGLSRLGANAVGVPSLEPDAGVLWIGSFRNAEELSEPAFWEWAECFVQEAEAWRTALSRPAAPAAPPPFMLRP